MNRIEDSVLSPSYFWSCLTLNEQCPFFSSNDPRLFYFGIGLIGMYVALVLTIVVDLKFYWSLDHMQRQVDFYLNYVKKKIKNIQVNQRRLVSAQERTEKQLKRSEQCNRLLAVLRGTFTSNDTDDPNISLVAQTNQDDMENSESFKWPDVDNMRSFSQ